MFGKVFRIGNKIKLESLETCRDFRIEYFKEDEIILVSLNEEQVKFRVDEFLDFAVSVNAIYERNKKDERVSF